MVDDLVSWFTWTCIVLCFYSSFACVCRMRHGGGNMTHMWKWLHISIFTLSLLTAYAIFSSEATERDYAVSILLAIYMHLTHKSWAHGIPDVAKNCCG